MKKILLYLLITFGGGTIITSCTKMDLNNPSALSQNQSKKVNPDVLDCGSGSHWDYYLLKCVPDCGSGYHNDSITGACVVDGGGGAILPDEISIITNSNNPYDSSGSRHNQAMSSIIGDLSAETTVNQIIQYTLNYLVVYSYDTSELRHQYNLSDSLATFGFTDVDSLAYKMYSIGEISSTAKDYMVDLSSLLDNVIGDNDPSDAVYEVFANDAITYENSIVSDNSLSTNEKTMLLSAYSVARYSGAYWGNYINNSSGGVSSQNLSIQTNSLSFLKIKKFWKKVLGADAAGAITGGGAAIESSKPIVRGSIFGAAVKELISPS